MNFSPYNISPLGDHALTIYFGDAIDEHINKKVLQLFQQLQQKPIAGVMDVIPAYTSLTVVYDIIAVKKISSSLTAYEYVKSQIENLLLQADSFIEGQVRTVTIPVCYDISLGIDLKEMASQKNMSIDEIIKLHTAKTYRVFMIGFLPGFAYMGTVDERIATPRKNAPRQNVVAGSVGIAGNQTGIYPLDSPGGWNIIGQTPLQLFDKNKTEPCLLQPGDEIIFKAISLQEFEMIKNKQ